MTRASLSILLGGPLVVGTLAFASSAGADPAAAPVAPPGSSAAPATAAPIPATPAAPGKPRTVRVKGHTVVPETPPLPAPELHLTLETPSPNGPWTLRLDNTGAVPLRALADARYLSFEISPPEPEETAEGEKHRHSRPPRPVRCELPPTMKPSEADDRALVFPPGRAYVERLDPLLFCFGARAAAALVPGAKVVAHLVGSRERPAVEAIEQVEPKVANVTDLVGAPATVDSPASTASVSASEDAATPPGRIASASVAPVALTTSAFADFDLGWEAEIEVTVTSTGASTALLFRPETIAFDVSGPSGLGVTDPSPTVRCAWPGQAPPPIPEVFTHLRPKQRASITVLLSALCPDGTLRRPGLYLVRARLDTHEASGASIGLRTFTGEVIATRPTRLRVRTQAGPPHALPRPQLVPPSSP
jgi:hypothetical protein